MIEKEKILSRIQMILREIKQKQYNVKIDHKYLEIENSKMKMSFSYLTGSTLIVIYPFYVIRFVSSYMMQTNM